MPNSPSITAQYLAAHSTGGYIERTDRQIIEVLGKDRAGWLHNLVTNTVKTLTPGEGNYAFAINVKGRTVFDLNYLVLSDRIWLDIDARWVNAALAHLSKYTIIEDVQLKILGEPTRRIAIIGAQAGAVVADLGLGNLAPMPWLQHVGGTIDGAQVRLIRNDFISLPCADLIITGPASDGAMEQVTKKCLEHALHPIEQSVVNILRIEAGIPASVDDIDEDVVPPETGQIERGISYHKGCYLGQEVIERMRSHGVLPRKLVGIRFDGSDPPPRNARVFISDKDIGRVVSGCFSEALQSPLSLAYVKAASAPPSTNVICAYDAVSHPGEIVAFPILLPN